MATPAIVHYRRADGTEADSKAWPDDDGTYYWTAPEDCTAITGFTFPPASAGQIPPAG